MGNIRRDRDCPWADFWHRVNMALRVAALILLAGVVYALV